MRIESLTIVSSGQQFRRGRCRGITLLEMVVVLTIVGVLGAIVFPSMTAGLDTLRLKSAADRLANTFRYARVRALRQQTVCQVTVDSERRRVELEDLEGATASGEPSYRRSWQLPPEIVVEPSRMRTFIFPPNGGMPRVGLRLINARGRAVTVKFDVLTALPRVEWER